MKLLRAGAAATGSTTLSWTCPRRSRPSNAGQPSDRLKINGELAITVDGRLSFDALQRRLVTSPAKARHLVATVPASYVAFDLLAIGGVDRRTQRWAVRRRRLEQLSVGWTSALQLSPVTDDVEEAREWFDVLPEAMGVEGLVVKGAASRYVGGRREWLKVRSVGVSSARNINRVALCLVRSSAPGGWLCTTGVADMWWWRDDEPVCRLAEPVDRQVVLMIEPHVRLTTAPVIAPARSEATNAAQAHHTHPPLGLSSAARLRVNSSTAAQATPNPPVRWNMRSLLCTDWWRRLGH